MTLEHAKQELVNRYRYLYENAYFILAPYMHEETEEEYEKRLEQKRIYGDYTCTEPLIYLNINILDNINSIFEEFLLSDKSIENTSLYKFVESKREEKEYLDQVKKRFRIG